MFSSTKVQGSGASVSQHVVTQGETGDVKGFSDGNYGSIDVSTFRGNGIVTISWNTVSVEYFQIAFYGDLPINYFTYVVPEGFEPLYVNDSRLLLFDYVASSYTIWRWSDADVSILAPAEWDGTGDVTCDIYY